MPTVYNKHHGDAPADAIYVGRPSKFGNPFTLDPKKKGQDREEVIQLYRDYLAVNPELVEAIKRELKGKDLVCFCKPKLCHADVLLEIANE